ncbi:carboxylesterase/lipase family protein [Propionivibrio limicola]|uniref:carboxylesterase/lipase family protein n=1 Tax=Propionivibrio limicola TaxID=167645 RepID=UPI001291412D|nr:carboxylesterase family protein [Propionivibrio limicola]
MFEIKKGIRQITAGLMVAALATAYGCGGDGDDTDSSAGITPPAQTVATTVAVDSGTIEGQKLASQVTAFYGIPYAAPPVGELRWKDPQPITWTGTKATVKMGNACAQAAGTAANGDTISEDCLYMNVWVPPELKENAKAPVVVYVHGGAFTKSSSSPRRFGGEQLAKKGVVYVNFNYRLGVFGNLALPELTGESPNKASGNYQLLDIIHALKWIQRNIAKFGGDPNNVTISGQSSGGIEMGLLNVSPLAKGLFHKIVAQSGWPGPLGNPPNLATQEQNGLKLMQATGASNLAALRGKTMDEVLTAASSSALASIRPMVAEPCIDGYAIPDKPDTLFAERKHNDVPLIAGYTSGENAPTTVTSLLTASTTIPAYQANLQSIFGGYWETVYNLFTPASDTPTAISATLSTLKNAASSGRASVYHATNVVVNGNSPAWVYIFSRPQIPAATGVAVAAPHGSDNQFWHGELDAPNADGSTYIRDARDTELANQMTDSLVAFAKTGNPSTSALYWPQYNTVLRKRMNFGNASSMADWDNGLDFFATTWLNNY